MAENSDQQGVQHMAENLVARNIQAAPSPIDNTNTILSVSSPSLWFDKCRQQFCFCITLTLIWPLLPLAFELITTDKVKLDSITLGASMYAVGIGVSSRNIALFGLGILQGFIFGTFYGFIISKTDNIPHYSFFLILPILGIVIIFFSHAVERYNRHVRLREQFPDFFKYI